MKPQVLAGRVAVVTGAAREGGIGRAICRLLLAEGASVVVSDVGTRGQPLPGYVPAGPSALDEAVADLGSTGATVTAMECDVTQPEDVARLVAETVARYGKLDIFVNNAGIATESVELVDVSYAGFCRTIDVNLTGTFLGIQAAARQLIAQGHGGRIINTASQAGKTGWPLLSAYSASKFGVVGLTQVAAKELGRHGITVNSVCPGTVDTPLSNSADGVWNMYARFNNTTPEQVRADMIAQIPLGRLQSPEDVADLVLFLASDAGRYITGQAINTTGGQEVH